MTTNFVLFRVERDRAAFLEALAARGVVMIGYPYNQVRAVPHYGVTRADIDTTIDAVRAALRETASRAGGRADGTAGPRGRQAPSRADVVRAGEHPTSRGDRPLNSTRQPTTAADQAPRAADPRGESVTQPRSTNVALTRPSDANPGPLDERFYDLVEERFRRLLRDHPPFATFVGIHDDDHLLGDGTLDASTRRWPTSARTSRRSRRSIRSTCRKRPASSATSRSTTCGGRSSTARSIASGSAGRRPWTRSATRSSRSSRATSRRSPSAWPRSPAAWRRRRSTSTSTGREP